MRGHVPMNQASSTRVGCKTCHSKETHSLTPQHAFGPRVWLLGCKIGPRGSSLPRVRTPVQGSALTTWLLPPIWRQAERVWEQRGSSSRHARTQSNGWTPREVRMARTHARTCREQRQGGGAAHRSPASRLPGALACPWVTHTSPPSCALAVAAPLGAVQGSWLGCCGAPQLTS